MRAWRRSAVCLSAPEKLLELAPVIVRYRRVLVEPRLQTKGLWGLTRVAGVFCRIVRPQAIPRGPEYVG